MSDAGAAVLSWQSPRWQALLPLPGATLRFATDLFADSAALFVQLRAEIAWEQHHLKIFGRTLAELTGVSALAATKVYPSLEALFAAVRSEETRLNSSH